MCFQKTISRIRWSRYRSFFSGFNTRAIVKCESFQKKGSRNAEDEADVYGFDFRISGHRAGVRGNRIAIAGPRIYGDAAAASGETGRIGFRVWLRLEDRSPRRPSQ